jgi:hypothetical protein
MQQRSREQVSAPGGWQGHESCCPDFTGSPLAFWQYKIISKMEDNLKIKNWRKINKGETPT